MFWKVSCEPVEETTAQAGYDGRYVVHRHHDSEGPHLDLRLEQAGYLMGWRIAGTRLDGEPWATEKQPHPAAWLDQNGDAVREDTGQYRWVRRDEDTAELLLAGARGTVSVRLDRERTLSADAARSVAAALEASDCPPVMAGQLVADGITARQRALERLCGLGRELDGTAFDEALWRDGLANRSLAEIHRHLQAYERRFDARYPPQPVSQPERIEEETAQGDRARQAMTILQNA